MNFKIIENLAYEALKKVEEQSPRKTFYSTEEIIEDYCVKIDRQLQIENKNTKFSNINLHDYLKHYLASYKNLAEDLRQLKSIDLTIDQIYQIQQFLELLYEIDDLSNKFSLLESIKISLNPLLKDKK